ncbi:MAG: citramalate synthase [Rickettsiales bacterium]|nr:citramalate synthase [Pseudomonadota bacterium]MDA0966576.1 citramalate synthase [Pseudomonadota bacterium]MDG4543605.1 citramalate synthase [Rickettsiales bacterium]MDG4545752.1 citramalate synthase [Rickettsiales bacterium]MDG4547475.1 citramalate synthase [Rickettsiales bacterium]
MMTERIYLYDSTLRDGAQTEGVDFSPADKYDIAKKIDELGIDYIEGGWPGANPTDDDFFAKPPKLKVSKLTAFGMTRRPSTTATNDPGLAALINSGVKNICVVGKTWDFHVTKALGTTLDENVKMVSESISHIVDKGIEAIFDAEHFFDGYKANKEYAVKVVKSAYEAGARWIVLCDTNGGSLPHEIENVISDLTVHVPGDHIGIHCHNDTDNAVANSLAAVRAGARHVQGTLNGVGERCGNANLISIIPTLILKMGFETGITKDGLKKITKISHYLDERLNKNPDRFAPYVGASAFAHKGGLHVSAVVKNPSSYEHIEPELVGNRRNILVSNQAGRSNIIARLNDAGFKTDKLDKNKISKLVDVIKQKESEGYAYESADASFEVLAHRVLGDIPVFFRMNNFRVIDERRWDSNDKLVTLSEATVHIVIDGEEKIIAADGNGPVNALDKAIRKALSDKYSQLNDLRLVDYKVRIINSGVGTQAITRVLIESEDCQGNRWTTVGVSANIIDASYNALRDSITYRLMRK